MRRLLSPNLFKSSQGRLAGVLLASCIVIPLSACNAQLPDPESEGARLYAARCNNCHRVYAPGSLKYEMWKVKIESMQGEMVRRGLPPLDGRERGVILGYLQRWSG